MSLLAMPGEARALRAGNRALGEDKPHEALKHAEALIAAYPRSVRAACLKALALHELDRSKEALETLAHAEILDPANHTPLLLQAVVRHDLGEWEWAGRAIGAARQLTHDANFIVAGMERLVLARSGERTPPPASMSDCPSIYNGFVGPRVLLYLEECVLAARDRLRLKECRWARPSEDTVGPVVPRSLKNRIAFATLRLPTLLAYRACRRPTMPLAAEEAYLRGDLAAARAIVTEHRAFKRDPYLRECAALLSMDLEEFQTCLNLLPPRADTPDPQAEYVRGYASLHLGKWQQAEEAFRDAVSQPLGWYFLGLSQAARGNARNAVRAFTREHRRNDLGVAERVFIARKTLESEDAPSGGAR